MKPYSLHPEALDELQQQAVYYEERSGLRTQRREGSEMKTVTLDVRSPHRAMTEALAAAKSGRAAKTARISFASPELLWRVLTAKRWEILKALCGVGPVSIREVSRRVGRDVKAVHSDVTALLAAGVLDKTDSGQVEFPYDSVRVEFMLEAA